MNMRSLLKWGIAFGVIFTLPLTLLFFSTDTGGYTVFMFYKLVGAIQIVTTAETRVDAMASIFILYFSAGVALGLLYHLIRRDFKFESISDYIVTGIFIAIACSAILMIGSDFFPEIFYSIRYVVGYMSYLNPISYIMQFFNLRIIFILLLNQLITFAIWGALIGWFISRLRLKKVTV
jgi:hypothetical protein